MKMLTHCFVLWIVFSASSSNAGLIRTGDVIEDSLTGVKWLEITQTVNLSFAAVQSQMSAGQQVAGWAHATLTQIQDLSANYSVSQVQSVFGHTRSGQIPGGIIQETRGIFDDGGIVNGVGEARFSVRRTSSCGNVNQCPPTITETKTALVDFLSVGFSSTTVGHWLVQVPPVGPPPPVDPPEPVPAPAGALMLLIAFVFLRSARGAS